MSIINRSVQDAYLSVASAQDIRSTAIEWANIFESSGSMVFGRMIAVDMNMSLGSCGISLFHLQHGVTAVGCAKFRDSMG